jgi:hypothetical protein
MEKMGNTFKPTSMVTPLNAEPGKADPGPGILNNPLMKPNDITGYLDDPTKPGGKKGK